MTGASIISIFRRLGPAFWIVLAALVLRLVFVLIVDPSPDFSGGDVHWYLENGKTLVSTGKTRGPLQTAPLYLVFVGLVQVVIPGAPSSGYYTEVELHTMRILQVVMGAALCLFVYALGRKLFSETAGRLAAGVLAISPALVIETGSLTTESLFMFLVFGGLTLYVLRRETLDARHAALVGFCLGLATLTRAVFLLFPLGLVLDLFLTQRTRWLRLSLALMVAYGALVSTWTVYNLAVWHRFVIGGEGLLSFIYQGATEQASPRDFDQELDVDPDDPNEARAERIRDRLEDTLTGDPVGWAGHRLSELGKAYLQPHNTVYFDSRSLRDMVWNWLRHDRSLGSLADILRAEAFWPKLVVYLFHFTGLLLGVIGMVVARRRWQVLLPLMGIPLYFTAIHLLLLALPRYVFPVYPVLWLFAAALIVEHRVFHRLSGDQPT